MRRRQTGVLNFAGIGRIRPVIIAAQESPVAIMHIEGGILQCARDGIAIYLDRGTQGTEQNAFRTTALDDETVDQDVVIRADIRAHREVSELARIARAQVVQLDHANPLVSIRAADDRGVIAGRQSLHDGGFTVVRRSQARLLDLRFLGRAPVVIYQRRAPRIIVEFEIWVLQSPRKGRALVLQRRSDGPRHDPFAAGPSNNESADADFVTSLGKDTAGNVH